MTRHASALASPALLAAFVVVLAASPAMAEGGGGGGGGESPALQNPNFEGPLERARRRAETTDRELEQLERQRRRPANPGPRAAPAQPSTNWVTTNTVRTPAGDIFTRPRGYVPLFPPGQTPPPEGWTHRHTLTNGWQIYSGYADGSVVVRSPDGSVMRQGWAR